MNMEVSQYKVKRSRCYLIYSIIFLIIAGIIFSCFYINGNSFIWKKDGMYQHYNSLMYLGKYLRDFISGIFNNGTFELPLWDFRIGYGADVITTLHYYVIGDPLNLLSAFVPKAYTEILYIGLIVLRFYLAGLAFSVYCRSKQMGMYETLLGAFIYAFCGFALIAGVRHPYFLNPMIYFPFLLLGIDKIYEKKKPYLFVVMVFISAVSSFYFFYMLTALAVIYAAVKFYHYILKNRIKQFFLMIGKFGFYYLTGVLMACFLFLPVVLAMLGGGRLDTEASVPLLYSVEYYIRMLLGYISPHWVGLWNIMGYTVIGAAAFIFLFTQKKEKKWLKIQIVILTLVLIFPIGGYILNGMSYVSNRWVWGYSFFIAYTVASMMAAMAEALHGVKIRGKQLSKKLCRNLILGVAAVSIIVNGLSCYLSDLGDYLTEFRDYGQANKGLTDNETLAVKDAGDSSFYRYEEKRYGTDINYNSALQTDLNSTSFYFSLANGSVNQFFQETSTNITKSFSYAGVDGRAFLGAPAGVKYFIAKEGEEGYLPYGYERAAGTYEAEDGTKYQAWENSFALPLGYTTPNVISSPLYDKLSNIEKQQAIIQGVVIEDAPGDKQAQLELNDESMEYKIRIGEGVSVDGDTIKVTRKNASIVLRFDGRDDSETYFSIDNLQFTSSSGKTGAKVKVQSDKTTKSFKVRTPENQWYEGTHDFLINTGYFAEGTNELTITFDQKGTYTFDDMQVLCQPMENFAGQISSLKKEVLEDVQMEGNQIDGNIEVSEDKYLVLSIPYSKGWSASIDGEACELKQANTMYMALEIPKGAHTITLKYQTPGLKLGIMMSVSGIVLFIGIIIWNGKTRIRRNSV